jgi:hypothetical protein
MRHRVAAAGDRRLEWHFGCNRHAQGSLVSRTARLGLAVGFPLLAVCAVVTPQLVTSSQSTVLAATRTTPATDRVDLPLREPDERGEEDNLRDFYGNDVTSAIAKYTFDATGSLYEVHSPQTELPRLASPKS